MSGESHNEICPECGGSLQVYTDWKPYSTAQGECIECGFAYYTKEDKMDMGDLIDRRIDYEWKKEEYDKYENTTKNPIDYQDWVLKETEKQFVLKKLEGEK